MIEAGLRTNRRVSRESEHELRPVADLIALRRLIGHGEMEKFSRAERHGEHLEGAVAGNARKRTLGPSVHQVLAAFRAVEFADDRREGEREGGGIRRHRRRLEMRFAGKFLKGIGACEEFVAVFDPVAIGVLVQPPGVRRRLVHLRAEHAVFLFPDFAVDRRIDLS